MKQINSIKLISISTQLFTSILNSGHPDALLLSDTPMAYKGTKNMTREELEEHVSILKSNLQKIQG